MQVANDDASANELPSREARPGRRVNNSAAGKLQGGELREDCVEGALECGLAGGERSVRGARGQQRRVGLGALERRDACIPASKLRCDEGLGGETQQDISYLGVHLQWPVQPVHRGEQGGQRAGVRLADEGGVQGCRGDCVQEGGCYLRVHLRGDGRLQGVRISYMHTYTQYMHTYILALHDISLHYISLHAYIAYIHTYRHNYSLTHTYIHAYIHTYIHMYMCIPYTYLTWDYITLHSMAAHDTT